MEHESRRKVGLVRRVAFDMTPTTRHYVVPVYRQQNLSSAVLIRLDPPVGEALSFPFSPLSDF